MSENRRGPWSRSVGVLRLFFRSEVRRPAIGWSCLLLGLLVAINGLNVINSYVGRDFITALSERNRRKYAAFAVLYAFVFAGSTLVAVSSRFAEERLRLLWRAWMTGTLIDRYLGDHTYYRLKARAEVDNPDQRITEDVKSFTQTTLSFLLMSLNATITSVAFLGVLWSITPWLVLVAVAYASAGSAATYLLGRSLARLDDRQLRKEADLRFNLIQVREASETIAVMGIEPAVRDRLRASLGAVVANGRRIIAVTRNVAFVTVGYNYLIQLIPLLIVAPLYLRGKVEFGVVTQSAMAFAQVIGAFSLFVTQFETLSSFAAVAGRLDRIAEAIEQAAAPDPEAIGRVEDPAGDRVAFEALTLRAPADRRVLVRDLSLELPRGGTLLVTGPNVAGASALFLATAGIWESGAGRIVVPPPGVLQFAPHRPFAARGTLRQRLQLGLGAKLADDRLTGALQAAGLGPALARLGGLDAEHDWSGDLAPGEQHLLAVARLLLARPRFAFLDRMNGDLAPDQMKLLYGLLAESGVAYVSLGEPRDLLVYHERILELRDDGGWQAGPAKPGSGD